MGSAWTKRFLLASRSPSAAALFREIRAHAVEDRQSLIPLARWSI